MCTCSSLHYVNIQWKARSTCITFIVHIYFLWIFHYYITWYLNACINYIHSESNIASSFPCLYLKTFDQLLNMEGYHHGLKIKNKITMTFMSILNSQQIVSTFEFSTSSWSFSLDQTHYALDLHDKVISFLSSCGCTFQQTNTLSL